MEIKKARQWAGSRVFQSALVSASALGLLCQAEAATPQEIVLTLRLAGTITGGRLSPSSPEYPQMLAAVERGDVMGAAKIAAESPHGTRYLLRRLALQMQNNGLDAQLAIDNDSTAFLIAHFAGVGGVGAPTISKIFSNNMTCRVRNGAGNIVPARQLSMADLYNIDWKTALVCTPGQEAVPLGSNDQNARVQIPVKHVGGFMTASQGGNDQSFAQNAFMAGTNLRSMKMMWEIATGMTINDFAVFGQRSKSLFVPKLIPQNDPSFLIGQGQTSCIACHGGGLVSTRHGYSTVANRFDFTNNGLVYQANPGINQQKGLGSNPNLRNQVNTCNLTNFHDCNPDSEGVDPNEGWDLTTVWSSTIPGSTQTMLDRLGWNGDLVGQGLNSLGVALGKAGIVYVQLTKRVIQEICPLGGLGDAEIRRIAASGEKTDDLRQIIAEVAAIPACQ